MQDLEDFLGVAIFERTKKHVMVTDKGCDLIEQATEILNKVDNLIDFAAEKDAPLSGKITIGAIPTIGPYLLPKILAKLRKKHPTLKVFLREEQTLPLLESLRTGRIDTAILALPYPLQGFHIEPLYDEPFSMACLPNHPKSNIKQLKTKHLQNESILLLEEGHCLRQHALDACKLSGASFGIPYQGTSLPTLVQMVANDIGITLIPEMALTSGILKHTGVIARGFSDGDVKRTIGMIWRPDSSKQNDLQLLSAFIKELHFAVK